MSPLRIPGVLFGGPGDFILKKNVILKQKNSLRDPKTLFLNYQEVFLWMANNYILKDKKIFS